jgi:hypothetical protein
MKYPRIIIHFTGCGYYYTTEQGKQLTKMYKTITRLRKYGKINK